MNIKHFKPFAYILAVTCAVVFVLNFKAVFADSENGMTGQSAVATNSPTDTAPANTNEPSATVSPDDTQAVASDGAITVDEPKIKVNYKTRKMNIGEKFKLKLQNVPEDAEYTWKSSNEMIASVTKAGKIHALATGKATISAKVNKKTYKCKVTVKKNGLAHPTFEMAEGETLTLHIKAGKKVKWSVTNDRLTVTQKNAGFVRVKANKTGKVSVKAKSDGVTYYCDVKVKKADSSVIYLTFDDGPSLSSTPKVLSILRKNKVNATFFVINYSDEGEKLIKQEIADGNAVAIHGYSHEYGQIYRSDAAYISNVTKLQDRLYKTLGYRVWATRFPGGSSNLVSRHYSRGIMSRLVKNVDGRGFAYFDWNVSSGDAGGATNSSQVYANVTKGLRKNRNNIVLMHDFANNSKTIGALDSIIKYGKSHGYVFKVITDSTTPVHHGVQN